MAGNGGNGKGIEKPKVSLADLMAAIQGISPEVRGVSARVANLEQGSASVAVHGSGTGTSQSTPMKPELYAELVRQHQLTSEAIRRELNLGNPQAGNQNLGIPRGERLPLPRNRRDLGAVTEEADEEEFPEDEYERELPFAQRRQAHRGRGNFRGRGRGANFGRNIEREADDRDDEYPEQTRAVRDSNLNSVKITIPPFKGTSDPDEYLEWKLKMERIFETNEMTDERKAAHAIASFEAYASTWWESDKRHRRRKD